MKKGSPGFTTFEVVLGVVLIVILGGGIIYAVNPLNYSSKFRNAQRTADAQSIMSAIQQKLVDDRGIFRCSAGQLPLAAAMKQPGHESETYYDMARCLVPSYLPFLPFDPATGHWNSAGDYVTGYQVGYSSSTGQIAVVAPYAEPPLLIDIFRKHPTSTKK